MPPYFRVEWKGGERFYVLYRDIYIQGLGGETGGKETNGET